MFTNSSLPAFKTDTFTKYAARHQAFLQWRKLDAAPSGDLDSELVREQCISELRHTFNFLSYLKVRPRGDVGPVGSLLAMCLCHCHASALACDECTQTHAELNKAFHAFDIPTCAKFEHVDKGSVGSHLLPSVWRVFRGDQTYDSLRECVSTS